MKLIWVVIPLVLFGIVGMQDSFALSPAPPDNLGTLITVLIPTPWALVLFSAGNAIVFASLSFFLVRKKKINLSKKILILIGVGCIIPGIYLTVLEVQIPVPDTWIDSAYDLKRSFG